MQSWLYEPKAEATEPTSKTVAYASGSLSCLRLS
jgi:hypothetical protein